MFYGQAQHSIDDKNRVILPSKYRENLGVSFFALCGGENCLYIYDEVGFREFEAKINALPDSDDGALLKRIIFENTERLSTDKQGRFVIPTALKDYAGLEKDVLFLGVSKRIEVWEAKVYENYKKQVPDTQKTLAELYKKFNI